MAETMMTMIINKCHGFLLGLLLREGKISESLGPSWKPVITISFADCQCPSPVYITTLKSSVNPYYGQKKTQVIPEF